MLYRIQVSVQKFGYISPVDDFGDFLVAILVKIV